MANAITRSMVVLSTYAMAMLISGSASMADDVAGSIELSVDEVAYREAIAKRAERIVAALGLEEQSQRERVAQLVADRYRELRDIHDRRDHATASVEDTPEAADKVASIKVEADHEIVRTHRTYVARLGAELSPELVTQIKDGMTYGVVTNTYNAYLALLPELSDEEKRMIKASLLEAREYAMDGGTSDEKHAWFGKYKGRINNYLSARGYNLKQAERDLANKQQ